uniref:BRO-M n=1 Tax=Lymantria dispar multicapsid nuclear polyhedrosis virus TaxID=10449 RepID=A0A0A0YZA7_NPVLD|nr:BRO-M [Lymantria dispar multiple nucleopolyhedrovirus]QCQ67404.1 BRO-M [Lymantria dispar multiple nucleopolyhedrovirus]QCQ67564.1 BRO-M [Lymantria dispar multiple nucleopolyhedrovirus]QCQ67722.1 BRO-M [Lymantria dispar multiple nucleopolyhedrovirus]WAK98652.1 153 Ld-bro-n [Lymantria dispar multiple nucleopolyhedrovirus]
MSQVKIGQFKFGEDAFTLRYVLERDRQVKFVARDIANSLKFKNTKKAIKDHVDDKYKSTFERGYQLVTPDLNSLAKQGDPLYLQPHTVLITKSGVIQLIMKSKLPYAVELQEWLLEEVIPQVLCTGKYDPAIKQREEENKQLVTKLIATFTDHTNALQAVVAQKTEELVKKQEFIERIVAMKDKQIEAKDLQVTRVMTDLNRMYTGFQETMQRKDEIMQQKDAQVTELVAKVVDLSERAVQYPADERKHPVLCVARDGTTFMAIAGQKSYVRSQKHKRNIDAASVVAEATRPNPTVDWNNATHRLPAKKTKRAISFESEEDARQFEARIKQLLRA